MKTYYTPRIECTDVNTLRLMQSYTPSDHQGEEQMNNPTPTPGVPTF